MKIGVDCNSLTRNLTGIGTYTYDVLRFLLEIDNENEYYLYSHKPLMVSMGNISNVYMRQCTSKSVVLWYKILLPIQIKKDKIDLFWEPSNRLPSNLPKNVRLVLTVHDMSSYLFPKYASWKTVIMEKLYMRRTCIRADKIICISYATKKDLINTFSINKNKVRVIYNGDTPYKKESKININKTNEIFGKYNISRGYFLFLGSISPRKNIETILRAYEVYREEGFKDKLVIAGKIAWKNKKINRLIKNSKYKDDIIVAGYVDEVEKEVLYRNADALLFPSLYEGFGFPILEAMSVGTIVITSNISSMPEVAKNAALYLNNLFDYKELADLMIKAVNMDKIQKDNMIELGYKRVALFNRRTTAKLTYELFMEWNTA